jgi:ATP-dependent DNA ligase
MTATGYRLRLERDGDRVRLITRGGYNWADRYPWIVEALKNRFKQFVIDGEAVVLGVDGIADFDAMHSRKYNIELRFPPFDFLRGPNDLEPHLFNHKALLECLLSDHD